MYPKYYHFNNEHFSFSYYVFEIPRVLHTHIGIAISYGTALFQVVYKSKEIDDFT